MDSYYILESKANQSSSVSGMVQKDIGAVFFFLKSWANDDILCDKITEDDQVWGGQSTEHLERLSLSVNTE